MYISYHCKNGNRYNNEGFSYNFMEVQTLVMYPHRGATDNRMLINHTDCL